MKKYWWGTLIFMIGFILGGMFMGYLAMNASKTYLHGVKLNFEIQQEATAYHFLKLGDYQRALVHYKNLADSQGGKNIYAFQSEYSQWSFSFPFAAIILEQIGKSSDPEGKGRRNIEAISIGNLASVMEKLHMQKESEEQWHIAAELAGHNDVARMKKTVSYLQEKVPDMSQLMVVFDKDYKVINLQIFPANSLGVSRAIFTNNGTEYVFEFTKPEHYNFYRDSSLRSCNLLKPLVIVLDGQKYSFANKIVFSTINDKSGIKYIEAARLDSEGYYKIGNSNFHLLKGTPIEFYASYKIRSIMLSKIKVLAVGKNSYEFQSNKMMKFYESGIVWCGYINKPYSILTDGKIIFRNKGEQVWFTETGESFYTDL